MGGGMEKEDAGLEQLTETADAHAVGAWVCGGVWGMLRRCLAHPWIQSEGVSAHRLHSSHHAFLLLRNLKIFENVEPSCLQELVGKLRTVLIEAGHYIARAGDQGDSMYFIKKGSVQVPTPRFP